MRDFDLLSTVRLSILQSLDDNNWLTWTELRLKHNLTDGNLSSHLRMLEKHKLITIQKRIVAMRPETRYRLSSHGKNSWRAYRDWLKAELFTSDMQLVRKPDK